MNLMAFILMDFWRNFRNFGNTFFIVVLPTALYLFFGVYNDWSEFDVGNGNASAWIMIGMAVYGAITATTALAGSAAVEIQTGWGRQLSLTAMPHGAFVLAKSVIALMMAVLPVVVLNVIAYFTVAQMPAGVWVATIGLTVIAALPFALYGLAVGLLFRSDAAVGAASGVLVIFGFLGNAFMPLEGVLLDIGRFTPMYGSAALARYPLTEGTIVGTTGFVGTDPLWAVLLNVVVWSLVFAAACFALQRRRTSR
ncbi:ABC transporter permease [Nesterenkonia massiliensis]|uniref:ABC transporter permease n=1 Tax=Nesterenkonia massiliensis TaxID=1232429 RepID=UPI0004207F1D|nr:ABC transporter permease [Nesterenkonia massiliensis]